MDDHKARFNAIFPPTYAEEDDEEDDEQQPDDITLHWLENVRGCLVGALQCVTHCDGVGDPELTLEIAKAHATCCKVIESLQANEE